jgi:hypothetical protein
MHRRLLSLARSSGFMLTLTIALGWGGGILTIVQAWFLARVVNDVFLGGQTREAVLPLLGILLGALLLKSAFVWGADVSANAVAQTVKTIYAPDCWRTWPRSARPTPAANAPANSRPPPWRASSNSTPISASTCPPSCWPPPSR